MIYHFSNCTLDVGRRELRRDGILRPIEPQVFDLLHFLIENRERLVTRDEIFGAIWRERIVSDSVLSTRINAARYAIGDSGKDQHLIRTLWRRGIRFVGPVRQETTSAPTRGAKVPAPQALPLSLQGMPTLIVVPFDNLSGHAANAFVADGLSEEIIAALSAFGWFKVVSRHSAFTDRIRSLSTRELAEKYAVTYVLGGSLRQIGDKIRVSVRLIDAAFDHQIWNGRYDLGAADVFSVQDEIAGGVAEAAANHLYAAESAKIRVATPESLAVWQCIVRAVSLINARKKQGIALAERFIRRALSIDPQSVPAISLLSFVATLRVHMGWQLRATAVPQALQIAHRALSVDQENAWAHLALGYASIYRQPEEAIAPLRQALALNPKLAMAYYLLALAVSFTGDYDSSFEHADRADEFKSYDLLARGNVGALDNVRATACFIAGRYREGVEFARKVIDVSPGQIPAYRQLAMNNAFAGDTTEAKKALATVRRLAPDVRRWISESAGSWSRPEDFQKYIEAFRLAGLPGSDAAIGT